MLQVVIPDQYITIGILDNKVVSLDWSKVLVQENDKKEIYKTIVKYLRDSANFLEQEKNCPEI